MLLAILFLCLQRTQKASEGNAHFPCLTRVVAYMFIRWDDDVVFRNQARGTENKGKKEFVNACRCYLPLSSANADDASAGPPPIRLPQTLHGEHLARKGSSANADKQAEQIRSMRPKVPFTPLPYLVPTLNNLTQHSTRQTSSRPTWSWSLQSPRSTLQVPAQSEAMGS